MSEQPVYYDIYNNEEIDLCFSPDVIEFQAEVRKILIHYKVPVFSGDFSKGYDFIASIKENGKDKLKLIKALENSTTHWIDKWRMLTEKLKDRVELIGVTRLLNDVTYISDFEKQFQKNEWIAGDMELARNWERDEIYAFDYLKTVKRFSRPPVESGKLGHRTGSITEKAQSEITKALEDKGFKRGQSDKDNGYDKLIVTTEGFILIENKIGNKRTWEPGPPSLLLSDWIKSVKKVSYYSTMVRLKVSKVIGVVPTENNLWQFPTSDKKIEMMTIDGLRKFVADPRLGQGNTQLLDVWKNRVILKMKEASEKVLTTKDISEHRKAFITITETGVETLKKLSKNPVGLLMNEFNLKKMEINVLREICNKKSDSGIMEIFGIGIDTLNTHKRKIYKKLSVGGSLSGKKENLIKKIINFLGHDLYVQFINQKNVSLKEVSSPEKL